MEDWEQYMEEDEHIDAALSSIERKFEGEDVKKVEEAKETQAAPLPQPKKKSKKNIGEKFENKLKNKRKELSEKVEKVEKDSSLTADEKLRRQKLVEEADHELTEELFESRKVDKLKTDQDYLDYAGEVSRKLTHGESSFRIPLFFKELLRDISTTLSSEHLFEIQAQVNILHSEKLKSERGPAKKKSKKNNLKGLDKKGGFYDPMGAEEETFSDEGLDEYEDFL